MYKLCLCDEFYSDKRGGWSTDADSVKVYLATCDQDEIAPQVAIVRGLTGHQVNVRHRCLGDQDAHALSAALSVRIDIDVMFITAIICQVLFCVSSYHCIHIDFIHHSGSLHAIPASGAGLVLFLWLFY